MGIWDKIKAYFVHPIVKTFGGLIKYQENDPGTPTLATIKDMPQMSSPCPPFGVLNFTGSDAPEGTIEHQAADLYCTIAFSLNYAQSKLDKPIIRWPALTKLMANPRSGKMFNAYYDRYYLNFFYETDPKTQQTIYTCESTDVVAHELGHAILDSIRPDLWSVQCVEIQAFHEAFGDINAILTAMTFPEMVKYALEETNGDLCKQNVISRLAEQMGLAIIHAKGEPEPAGFANLRNAVNVLQYVAPETLPTHVPNDGLAGEPHSFSRVFVGGWYDAFAKVYEAEKAAGATPEQAVYNARDRMAKITYNGVRLAKVNTCFYYSVLNAMLTYDAQHGTGIGKMVREGFAMHNLIAPDNLNMITEQHGNSSVQTEILNLISNNLDSARLSDFIQNDNNPFNNCIIELPNQKSSCGHMDSGVTSLRKIIHVAKHSLKVLHDHDKVGNGPTAGKIHEKEFTIIDGRLVRNFYCCHFCKRS